MENCKHKSDSRTSCALERPDTRRVQSVSKAKLWQGCHKSGEKSSMLRMIAEAEPVALAGVIVTEILQSLKRDVSRLEHHLSQWGMLEPNGFSTYREAASIFSGRTFERYRRYADVP